MNAPQLASRVSMLDHALDHARSGLPVFPCRPDKTPYPPADLDANGNKIRKTGGLYKATTDEATITAWWTRNPNAMIGLRMGKASGLFAIDPDAPKEAGVDRRFPGAQARLRGQVRCGLETKTAFDSVHGAPPWSMRRKNLAHPDNGCAFYAPMLRTNPIHILCPASFARYRCSIASVVMDRYRANGTGSGTVSRPCLMAQPRLSSRPSAASSTTDSVKAVTLTRPTLPECSRADSTGQDVRRNS